MSRHSAEHPEQLEYSSRRSLNRKEGWEAAFRGDCPLADRAGLV
ncbi:hypothetical protein ACFL41_00545 [Gemmatimonadota bacterium]